VVAEAITKHCSAVTFRLVSDIVELTAYDCALCPQQNALMTRIDGGRPGPRQAGYARNFLEKRRRLGGEMGNSRNLRLVEVTFSYRRVFSGKSVHGGVTLRFDSTRPYGFASQAQWPDSDNYTLAIREVVEATLRECQGHLDSTEVLLVRIDWDVVNSCEVGFRNAAAEATRSAFRV